MKATSLNSFIFQQELEKSKMTNQKFAVILPKIEETVEMLLDIRKQKVFEVNQKNKIVEIRASEAV